MGSFLDKPKTEKIHEVDKVEGNGLRCGASSMQGWRIDMEDAHTIKNGVKDADSYSWFAVYDGHGGSLTSTRAADEDGGVLDCITKGPKWAEDRADPEVVKRAVVEGFLAFDKTMEESPAVASGDDHSGSTAITALVTPSHIYVGNCGDSRCILVRDGSAVEMSIDHKPYLPSERDRIVAAGGTVTMRRVNGDLAVSRALGDFVYKRAKAADGRPLAPELQQVSPEPEVKVVERSPLDQFLVLACDGIWDVMSNEDVALFVLKLVKEGADPDAGVCRIARELIDHCLAAGSRDNMTVVVVALPGAPKPGADAKAAGSGTVPENLASSS